LVTNAKTDPNSYKNVPHSCLEQRAYNRQSSTSNTVSWLFSLVARFCFCCADNNKLSVEYVHYFLIMASAHTSTGPPSLHSANEDAAKVQRIDKALECLLEEHSGLTGNERDLEQLLKRLETEEKALSDALVQEAPNTTASPKSKDKEAISRLEQALMVEYSSSGEE
jgi:hypothetical protein